MGTSPLPDSPRYLLLFSFLNNDQPSAVGCRLFRNQAKRFPAPPCLSEQPHKCVVQLMKSIQAIRSRLPLSFILVGGLCLLLPVLAFLQYQWIGQISESERERLEEGLDASTRRFVDDIVGEFSSIALSFQTQPPTETFPLEDQLARNLDRWNRAAPYPSIVRSVYVSTPDADGELNLLRFDPESGTLVTIPWSEATKPLKERLGQLTDFSRARFDFRRNSAPDRARIFGNQISENNDSAWILAPMIAAIDLWEGNIDRGFTGWTLVEIDTRAFASDLLPDVVETHFDPEDYEVVIFESNQSDEIVFRSEEELSRDTMASPDVAIRALAPQPPPSDGLAPARGRGRGRGRVPRRSMGFGLPPEGLRPGLGPQAVPIHTLRCIMAVGGSASIGISGERRINPSSAEPVRWARDSCSPWCVRHPDHHLVRTSSFHRPAPNGIRSRNFSRIEDPAYNDTNCGPQHSFRCREQT